MGAPPPRLPHEHCTTRDSHTRQGWDRCRGTWPLTVPSPPPPPGWYGVGEGGCPPRGPDTEQGNRDSPGALLAPPPEGTEGGVGEVRVGQAEGEGEGTRG